MNSYVDTLDGNCGVEVAYNFIHGLPYKDDFYGRTNLVVCGFVNRLDQKRAYDWMCKNYKLIFQSPLRRGSNGDEKGYFLCVFDRKKQ
jgi:hypothetical protein